MSITHGQDHRARLFYLQGLPRCSYLAQAALATPYLFVKMDFPEVLGDNGALQESNTATHPLWPRIVLLDNSFEVSIRSSSTQFACFPVSLLLAHVFPCWSVQCWLWILTGWRLKIPA